MFGLFSPFGLMCLGFYIYVAIAAGRAEQQTGSNGLVVFTKAITWPITIWGTIKRLYLTPPRL